MWFRIDFLREQKMENTKNLLAGSFNKKSLLVASLGFKIRDDDLLEIFSAVGSVTSAKVVMDYSGRSRGYGFVEMEDENLARVAINKLDGTIHFSHEIIVTPLTSSLFYD